MQATSETRTSITYLSASNVQDGRPIMIVSAPMTLRCFRRISLLAAKGSR